MKAKVGIKIWTDGNRKAWFRKGSKKPTLFLTLDKFDSLKRCSRWKLLHIAYPSGRKTLYDLKSETSHEQ